MDPKRKNGYIAGIVSLLGSSIFGIFVINYGLSLSGQILAVLALIFGVLGIGSLLKPESIGEITSQLLKNIAKNMEEQTNSDSHNNQTQKKFS